LTLPVKQGKLNASCLQNNWSTPFTATGNTMKQDIVLAFSLFILLFIVSFICSIVLGMGKAESLHEPLSLWMYARRGLMIFFGLIIPYLRKQDSLAAFGWKAGPQWIFITLGAGLLIGFGNKGGFNPASSVAVMLALYHTFATELFFRRYLLKTFSHSFTGMWPPVLISSFMYGLFYLTVWTTWELPLTGKIIFVFLFTGLGILFSYCYKKSGSFLVPWLMHFFGVLSYRMLL
jgi:putative solute:sodium symporter small subunit